MLMHEKTCVIPLIYNLGGIHYKVHSWHVHTAKIQISLYISTI